MSKQADEDVIARGIDKVIKKYERVQMENAERTIKEAISPKWLSFYFIMCLLFESEHLAWYIKRYNAERWLEEFFWTFGTVFVQGIFLYIVIVGATRSILIYRRQLYEDDE